jgi:hypothetical protein
MDMWMCMPDAAGSGRQHLVKRYWTMGLVKMACLARKAELRLSSLR